MDNDNDENDYRRDAFEERERRNAQRCRCHGDMPGHCPGPAYCPMCETDAEDAPDAT